MKAMTLDRLLHLLFAAVLLLLLMLQAAMAQGAPPCMAFAEIAKALKKWNEVPISTGLVNEGAIVILFASPGGASWTFAVRKANGEVCFLAAGTNWSGFELTPAGTEG